MFDPPLRSVASRCETATARSRRVPAKRLIVERTQAGLAAARARGRRGGRHQAWQGSSWRPPAGCTPRWNTQSPRSHAVWASTAPQPTVTSSSGWPTGTTRCYRCGSGSVASNDLVIFAPEILLRPPCPRPRSAPIQGADDGSILGMRDLLMRLTGRLPASRSAVRSTQQWPRVRVAFDELQSL